MWKPLRRVAIRLSNGVEVIVCGDCPITVLGALDRAQPPTVVYPWLRAQLGPASDADSGES
jgi:hypothetical protein